MASSDEREKQTKYKDFIIVMKMNRKMLIRSFTDALWPNRVAFLMKKRVIRCSTEEKRFHYVAPLIPNTRHIMAGLWNEILDKKEMLY